MSMGILCLVTYTVACYISLVLQTPDQIMPVTYNFFAKGNVCT